MTAKEEIKIYMVSGLLYIATMFMVTSVMWVVYGAGYSTEFNDDFATAVLTGERGGGN